MTRNEYLQAAALAAINCPAYFEKGVSKWVEDHVIKLEKIDGFKWGDEIIAEYEEQIKNQKAYIENLLLEIEMLKGGGK